MNKKDYNLFLLTNKNLKSKYEEKFFYFHINLMNEIIEEKNQSIAINLKDLKIYDISKETAKRYYKNFESNIRIANYIKSYSKIEYKLIPNLSKWKLFKVIINREFKLYKLKNMIYKNRKKSKRKNLNFNVLRKLKNSEYLIDFEVSSLLINKKYKIKKKSVDLSYYLNKDINNVMYSFSDSIHDIFNPDIIKETSKDITSFNNSLNSSFNNSLNNTFLLNLSNITLGYKNNKSNNLLNTEINIIKEFNKKLNNKEIIDEKILIENDIISEENIEKINQLQKSEELIKEIELEEEIKTNEKKDNNENDNNNKKDNNISINLAEDDQEDSKILLKKKSKFKLDFSKINSSIKKDNNISNRKIKLNFNNKKTSKLIKKYKRINKNRIEKNKQKLESNVLIENNLERNFFSSKINHDLNDKKINTDRDIDLQLLKKSNNTINTDNSSNNNKKYFFYRKAPQSKKKDLKKISHLFDLNLKTFSKNNCKARKIKNQKNFKKSKNKKSPNPDIKTKEKIIKTSRSKDNVISGNKEKIIKTSRNKDLKNSKNKDKKNLKKKEAKMSNNKKKIIKNDSKKELKNLENLKVTGSLPNFKKLKKVDNKNFDKKKIKNNIIN